MSPLYLLDTCVFIDYFLQKEQASNWLLRAEQGQIEVAVSTLTIYELWKGARNDTEKQKIRTITHKYRLTPPNRQIAQQAAAFYKSIPKAQRGPHLDLDVLTAATAEYYRADIVTSNIKHFNLITFTHSEIVPLTSS